MSRIFYQSCKFVLLFFVALLPISSQGQNELPSLGDSSSSIVSPQQEHLLGRAWLGQLRGQTPTIDDPEIKAYSENFIYKLLQTSQVKDRNVLVVILDDPEINAFAVPGGIVGINMGLWLYSQNEQQFASVLAHELAHLSQRHFARQVERAKRNQPLDIATVMASAILLAVGGGDAGSAALFGSQAAIVNRQLGYSREYEQEADRIGMLNLEKAGMDPRAMPNMFKQLALTSRYLGQEPPEFLMTHPVTSSRIADTEARAAQYPKRKYKSSEAFYLIKKRVQLYYLKSSHDAIERQQLAIKNHQGNEEANIYGLALAYSQANQTQKALNTLKPLFKKYYNDPTISLAQAQILRQGGQPEKALPILKKALAVSPDDFPLQYFYAATLMANENYRKAESVLEALSESRPDDPDIWSLLSQAYGMNKNIIGVYTARAKYYQLNGNLGAAIAQLQYAQKEAKNSFATRQKLAAEITKVQAYKQALDNLKI